MPSAFTVVHGATQIELGLIVVTLVILTVIGCFRIIRHALDR